MIPRKNLVSIVIIIAMALSTVQFLAPSIVEASPGKTLYVGGNGPGNYTTIQDAIIWSHAGDTIYVYPGTYHGNITIRKSISLIGEDKNNTIINAEGFCFGVTLLCNGVELKGFTIINGDMIKGEKYASSILLYYSDNNIITDNIISSHMHNGIILESSFDNTIANNTIQLSANGIYLMDSENNLIKDNTIISNRCKGIKLSYDSDSNTISGNIVMKNNYGIWIHRGTQNIIKNNTIAMNKMAGLFSRSYSSTTTISGNHFISNIGCGLHIEKGSSNNLIYHNNFINNHYHAYDYSSNIWNLALSHGGNYWDDFDEPIEGAFDNDNDGVLDTPYGILGGENQDLYPLSEIVGKLPDIEIEPIDDYTNITPPTPPNNLPTPYIYVIPSSKKVSMDDSFILYAFVNSDNHLVDTIGLHFYHYDSIFTIHDYTYYELRGPNFGCLQLFVHPINRTTYAISGWGDNDPIPMNGLLVTFNVSFNQDVPLGTYQIFYKGDLIDENGERFYGVENEQFKDGSSVVKSNGSILDASKNPYGRETYVIDITLEENVIRYSEFQQKGDSDSDGDIDVFDLDAFAQSWGSTKNPGGNYKECFDFNEDGKIDVFDLDEFAQEWGKQYT